MSTSLALALPLVGAVLAQQDDPQARYDAQRLERRSYEQVTASITEPEPLTTMPTAGHQVTGYAPATIERWGVFAGEFEQLDAYEFARLVGDASTLAELEARALRSRRGGLLSTGLGAALLGGGIALLVTTDQSQDDATLRSSLGAGVSLAGLVGTAAGLRVAIAPRRLHGAVDHTWGPEQADTLIEDYNRQLRRDLGLNAD